MFWSNAFEFVPVDVQERLHSKLQQMRQRNCTDLYDCIGQLRELSQIRQMGGLNQATWFIRGLAQTTREEVIYRWCQTVSDTTIVAQQYVMYSKSRSKLLSRRATVTRGRRRRMSIMLTRGISCYRRPTRWVEAMTHRLMVRSDDDSAGFITPSITALEKEYMTD